MTWCPAHGGPGELVHPHFRPLHAFSRDRLRSLEAAFADGGFPPIVTVKLGEAYFVSAVVDHVGIRARGLTSLGACCTL